MATTFYNLLKLPLIFFLYLLPSAHSVYFQMPPFESNTSNIIYHGDAVPSVRAIEMNKVNFLCRVGWATYFERVPLWDYSENLSADFTARFSFIIDTQAVLIMVMGLHSSWLLLGWRSHQILLVALWAYSIPQIVIHLTTKLFMLSSALSWTRNGIW